MSRHFHLVLDKIFSFPLNTCIVTVCFKHKFLNIVYKRNIVKICWTKIFKKHTSTI